MSEVHRNLQEEIHKIKSHAPKKMNYKYSYWSCNCLYGLTFILETNSVWGYLRWYHSRIVDLCTTTCVKDPLVTSDFHFLRQLKGTKRHYMFHNHTKYKTQDIDDFYHMSSNGFWVAEPTKAIYLRWPRLSGLMNAELLVQLLMTLYHQYSSSYFNKWQ